MNEQNKAFGSEVGGGVFRKLIYLTVLSLLALVIYPAAGTYDFRDGLNKDYAGEWLNMYVLPNYDTSRIEQVNSAQSFSLEYEIGEPFTADEDAEAVLGSEFEGEFHIINDNDIFHMLLVNEGEITGIYTNNDEVTVNDINIQGMDRRIIYEVYGEPVSTVDKGEKHLVVENEEYDVFEIGDIYVFFFYDLHEADQVNGMLIVDKSEMASGSGLYNHPSAEDNAQMNFHLINATRLKYGVGPLEYDAAVGEAARKHSMDMSANDYFSHVSPGGGTLKTRMMEMEIPFRLAGENIATGHTSPIFSHHSLMNSKAHRVNTLNDDYTHIGIGVDYNSDDVPYYTENYTKK